MKANRTRKMSVAIAAAMAITLVTGSVNVFANSTKNGLIGEAKAKQIALNNAGFKEKEVSFVRVALDVEDGRQEYDVEFYKGKVEYDYEIDAKTGKILDLDFDIEDFVIPSNNNNAAITVEKAKEIALDHARLKASDVKFVKAKLETDDGQKVYDIEFYRGNVEYDYEIDAKTGKVLDFDFDIEDFVIPNNNNNASITLEKAKQIALSHAGLKASDVKFVKAELDNDDGQKVYDIEFYKGNVEYDYEIDAKTGKIVEFDKDIENFSVPNNNNNASITLEKAKQIALNHAGLSASQVTFTKAKTDRDDGRLIYDIEFYTNGAEYDYEIDVKTGKVLEYDIEENDDRDDNDWDDNDWDDEDWDD